MVRRFPGASRGRLYHRLIPKGESHVTHNLICSRYRVAVSGGVWRKSPAHKPGMVRSGGAGPDAGYLRSVMDDKGYSKGEAMGEPSVPLREYLRAEIAALRELMKAEQGSLALAVKKQEDAYNARFEGVNEFRAALDDAVNRAASREYVDAKFSDIERRLNVLESKLANYDGRVLGYSAGVGLVVLIISIATQLINFGG